MWVSINREKYRDPIYSLLAADRLKKKKKFPSPKSMFALLRASLGVHWKQFCLSSTTVQSPYSSVCQPVVVSRPESTGFCCLAVPDHTGQKQMENIKCDIAPDEW